MSSWRRRARRIAAWLALAIIYGIAFHYAKKYEAEMLTGLSPVIAAPVLFLRRACAWIRAYLEKSQARMTEDVREELWW
jgi:hypothetical protein